MPSGNKQKKAKPQSEAARYVERYQQDFDALFALSQRGAGLLESPSLYAQVLKVKELVQAPEHLALIRNPAQLGPSVHRLRAIYQHVIELYSACVLQQGGDPFVLLKRRPYFFRDLVPFVNALNDIGADLIALVNGFAFLALHITSSAESLAQYPQLETELALAQELFKKLKSAERSRDASLSSADYERIERDTHHMMNDLYMTVCRVRPDLKRLTAVIEFLEQTRQRGVHLLETEILGLCYIATTKYPDFAFLEQSIKNIIKMTNADESGRHLTLACNSLLSFYAALAKTFDSVKQGRVLSEEQCLGLLLSFNHIERFLSKKNIEIVPISLRQRALYSYQLFSVLFQHKNSLSNGVLKTLCTLAQSILKEKNDLDKTQQDEVVQKWFTLLAGNKVNTSLSEIKAYYTAYATELLQGKDLLFDSLAAILAQAKEYSIDDYHFLLHELVQSSLRTAPQLYLLLQHFVGMSAADKRVVYADFIHLCRQHHELIALDVDLLQLLTQQLDEAFLVEAGQTVVLSNKANYRTWQAVYQRIVNEVKGQEYPLYWRKIAQAFAEVLQSEPVKNTTDFVNSAAVLDALWQEYQLFFQLINDALQKQLSVKLFIRRWTRLLKDGILATEQFIDIRHSCEQAILEQERQSKAIQVSHLEMTRARQMLESGSFDDLEQVNRWLHAPAKNIEWYLMKIRCLVKLEHYDEVLVWLPKTLSTFPGQQEKALYLAWAACCKALGQYQDALKAYQHVAQLERMGAEWRLTRMNMAYCHQQLGTPAHVEQAQTIYAALLANSLSARERIQVLHALAHCYMQNNQFTQAYELIAQLPSEAKTNALRGKWHFMQQHYSQAIGCYEAALADFSHLGWLKSLWQCYVFSAQFTGENKDKFYTRMGQHEEKTTGYLRLKVLLLMHDKEYEQALLQLDLMHQAAGKSLFTYVQRVLCYRALNRYQEAITLLTSYPDYYRNKLILKHLAVTYAMIDEQEKALHCFDYLLSEYPGYSEVYFKAITYSIKIKDLKRVQEYWHQCQEFIPAESPLRNKLAALVTASSPRESLDTWLLQTDTEDGFDFKGDKKIESSLLHPLQSIGAHPEVITKCHRRSNALIDALDLALFKPEKTTPVATSDNSSVFVKSRPV